MNHPRKSAPWASAAAVLVCATGFAGVALAHPHEEGKKVRQVVVIGGQGGDEAGKGERVQTIRIERGGEGEGARRVVRIERDGKGEAHALHIRHAGPGEHRVRTIMLDGKGLADCDGGEKLVDESAGDDKEKTKVVICRKGDGDPAASAERLEKVLARINSSEHLSAEHKEKVAASLRAAIDRTRSAR